MSKVKFKFKITGLEIEFEGSREDVPLITNTLGSQVQNLLNPLSEISADDSEVLESTALKLAIPVAPKRKRKNSKSQSNGQASGKEDLSINWRHNSAKYSSPTQDWKIVQKALWILYVVAKECQIDELSAPGIAATFNKHFKSAGTIKGNHISRDFGKYKQGKDALVNENSSIFPAKWFLTEKGIKEVEILIQDPKD